MPVLKKTGKCALHKYHYPAVRTTEVHHIWPKEYHGPANELWNQIELGPTEHSNIHLWMDRMLAGKTDLPVLTRKELAVATKGYMEVLHYVDEILKAGPVR